MNKDDPTGSIMKSSVDNQPHPGAIFIQLHTYCNAKCINCPHPFAYGGKGVHPKGIMEERVWNKIIQDIQSIGYRNQIGLYLHHEPLIDPDLFKKMTQVHKETEAFVVISTNGSLLDQKARRNLIESRPRAVHININSADKEQYEKMTGLSFERTIHQVTRFIDEAASRVFIEINCPVLPGVDTEKLVRLFPNTKVNVDYWANSRGGLLPDISSKNKGSRFRLENYCKQPELNFNILYDGSIILCCNDWMHESKKDFPNIMDAPILEIYCGQTMKEIIREFKGQYYRRYRMCSQCAQEMGFIKEEAMMPKKAFETPAAQKEKKYSIHPMSILLATNHLFTFTGSEITIYTIAKFLVQKGHRVTLYSKYIDPHFIKVFKGIAQVFNDIRNVSDAHFDVAYVQHNAIAMEVRHQFPGLPMVYASLGVLPFLEQPPFLELNITAFLAISEEVRDNLIKKGIEERRIGIFRNIVDSQKFRPLRPINAIPRTALVYSYKIDDHKLSLIHAACEKLGIQCKRIGERPGIIDQEELAAHLNQSDIVFTLGRGVIETMMCGRIPIVYDYLGGDGMVTPENIYELATCNFSGRRHRRRYNIEELISEIKAFNPAKTSELRRLAVELFDANRNMDGLVDLFKNSIHEFEKEKAPVACHLSEVVELINTTKTFSESAFAKTSGPQPGIPPSSFCQNQIAENKGATRLIAFYLPQYHPIPENDTWWGKGFTEWTNVAKSRPLFDGHYQPHLPADLGFYDLRLPETRKAQAELAKEHGIHGFCYYHYWFNGRLLLERPLQEVLRSGEPDFPFCLCWANESWTRVWDGGENHILMEQEYSEEDDRRHIRYLCEIFRDRRYIRVKGRPLFLIYRANRFPDPLKTTNLWREEARRIGIGELFLCRVESFPDERTEPGPIGFDAAVEFQPDWNKLTPELRNEQVPALRAFRYDKVVEQMLRKERPGYKRFPCVTPSWDSTPRHKERAIIFTDSSPELYEKWLRGAIEKANEENGDEIILFINAWNEWGEGNHLEPDLKFGRAYLEATRRSLIHEPGLRPGLSGHASHDQAEKGPVRFSHIGEHSDLQKNGSFTPSLVSIIIPVLNNLNLTHQCLKSIFLNTSYPNYEILAVDNGSTDGTAEYLKQMKNDRVRSVFLGTNKGFVEACRSGAAAASGEYVLFLNNDTEVQEGWLTSLVHFMEGRPDCGAVGAKLVYPDGRLQEAGGIIFSDGNGWNYGRGMDPSYPRFNFVREVDYCSGAALMVRKRLWDEIGGFDQRYSPAYYEDTDLCFEIRKRGYKVFYQPKSVVVHHEGKTSGTDPSSGYKRFQAENRIKFKEKWSEELKGQFPYDSRNVARASDRGNKRSILVIDPFLPLFDRASGSLRLFHLLKLLKELDFHVVFIARNGSMENRYRPILEDIGIEVYAWDPMAMKAAGESIDHVKPIPYEILFQEHRFEFAVIDFWDVAEYYLPLVRRYCPETKIIVDTVDIHYIREMREAELKRDEGLKKKAAINKKREIEVYRRADRLWVVTDEDRKAIQGLVGDIPIDILPNVHSKIDRAKRFEETSDLLFVGNFNHPPNRDAAAFFCKEIFPLILKELPGVKLFIVGNNPGGEIKALASDHTIVTGYVEDLSPYLHRARISVNPLRYGAGMKGKIGEALSWGLPVVTTSIGGEGMGLTNGADALIADSADLFARRVVELYRDRELWNNLSLLGKEKVETEWSPEAMKARLENVFKPVREPERRNLISIIILAYDQMEYTKKCLDSIFRCTDEPFELILVNNGSKDGTAGYLEGLKEGRTGVGGWRLRVGKEGEVKAEKERPGKGKRNRKEGSGIRDLACRRFKVIRNEKNVGFAAGNNQGMAEARGDYLLLMNNDVVVTPGWLGRMTALAESKPDIGIVGPMSNYVSGPQWVKDISYDPKSLEGLHRFALAYAQVHQGMARPFWRVVGFCMLIKREVVRRIGGLDERYGAGNFEDDDFSLRAKLAGFESWIAGDCFVHHFGSRTFEGARIDYRGSLNKNWEIFKKKWDIPLEVAYESPFDLTPIFKQGFTPVKHYYPLTPEAFTLSRGEELFQSGDVEGAKETFKRLLQENPDQADALNNLGVIAFQEGKMDQAVTYFEKGLKLQPHHTELLENLGQCLMTKKEYSEAKRLFERAIELRPDSPPLLNSFGHCLIQAGDFSLAEEMYSKSYQIDDTQAEVREILAGLGQLKVMGAERRVAL